MKLHNVVISFASMVHLVWAALLLFSPAPINATPISGIYTILGLNNGEGALLLGGIAWMALIGAKREANDLKALVLVLPQQTLLFLSAATGLLAATHGHYADGVARPWSFILADQIPMILLGFLYTCGILEKFKVLAK